MPAPSVLAKLPKPVLFGLYGAAAGLIGALALAEPAWRGLRPPPPPPPAPQVAVAASAAVQLYPGSANAVVVHIARDQFDGPVEITFDNPPAGVTIAPISIPATATTGEAKVEAAADARPGTSAVSVAATATNGDAAVTAATTIEIGIVAPPPPPPRLAVAVAPRLTIYPKGTCTVAVQVARGGFDGPVGLRFENLPAGVAAPPVVVPAGKTDVEVVLTAAETAPLGTVKLTLSADATSAGAALTATAATALTTEPAPLVPVDVVFVLDVTGSMGAFINGVRDGILEFAKELDAKQIDARIGVLAFRDRFQGEEAEPVLFEEDSPFTKDTKLFATRVGRLKATGGGSTAAESSLDAVADAARLPFRQGAAKVLLLITDAPPLVPDKSTQTVAEAVGVLKKAEIDQLHIVVRDRDRKVYEELQGNAKGKFFDLERVTRGGEKFARILPELSKAIAATVSARPARAEVVAAPPPPTLPAGPVATPAAAAAPAPPAVRGVQSSARFAAGSEGRLVLAIGGWTGAIAGLVCLALLAGQHHYLRGALPGPGRAAAGLGGGAVVGLVGGAAGQGLFLLAPDSPALVGLFRVIGWTLLGGLAGIGLSLFIPNLKTVYGLLGGALGGAFGALGFLGVSAVTDDLTGRLAGGLVLGFCIGVMVVLMEAAFRRAWLEVRYGPREVVTVNLGPEPVKVGSDRACTVWARGAAPVALRYFVRESRVVCEDVVGGRTAAVGDGERRDLGGMTVVVRTAGGTGPAGGARAERVPPARPPLPRSRPGRPPHRLPRRPRARRTWMRVPGVARSTRAGPAPGTAWSTTSPIEMA